MVTGLFWDILYNQIFITASFKYLLQLTLYLQKRTRIANANFSIQITSFAIYQSKRFLNAG